MKLSDEVSTQSFALPMYYSSPFSIEVGSVIMGALGISTPVGAESATNQVLSMRTHFVAPAVFLENLKGISFSYFLA